MMADKDQVLSALKWTAAAKLGAQLVSWAVTLCVIRLLSPVDYGLAAMSTVVIALFALLAEMGLDAAIIQAPRLDEMLIRRLQGAVLILNTLLSTAVVLCAPLAAGFFEEPRLLPIIQVAGVHFIITAFAVVPDALLRREMHFKRIALTDMSTNIAGGVVSLLLALQGMGVWALVLGNLVFVTGRSIVLLLLSERIYLPSFRIGGLGAALSFGGQMTLSRVLWHVLAQADITIAGKVLGKEAVGIYAVAMHLATMPMQKTMSVVNQVAFPALSRSRIASSAPLPGVERGIRFLAIGAIPVLWGMAAVAPEIVTLLLGEKWSEAVVVLQLVACVVPFRMILGFLSTATCAAGRADVALRNIIFTVIVMLTAFAIGVRWGLPGLASAWVIGVPVTFAVSFPRLRTVLNLDWHTLLRLAGLPLVAGAVMVLAVSATRILIGESLGVPLNLAVMVLVGALAFIIAATVFDRKVWSELRLSLGSTPS